ncbi:hypothetical protein [Herbiconiux sp.]|uniref:hypothetical protein n=1 Tax=Herbiconiux sp. TaxID=1871186 RepID=UPI0025C4A8F4|nr:hypothetical protein [Herbiconiux sp.]
MPEPEVEEGGVQSLSEIADELYSLAPSEFVEARNARAAGVASGDRERAARIRSFVKPPVAAWAVNALVRNRPDEVDDLLDLGRRMRDASTALDRAALQELGRERQRMLASLARSARELGAELGVPVSEAAATLVQHTFQAALADADAAEAVQSGMLTRPLASSGVDPVDLAGAVALPLRLASGGRAAPASDPGGGSADSSRAAGPSGADDNRAADGDGDGHGDGDGDGRGNGTASRSEENDRAARRKARSGSDAAQDTHGTAERSGTGEATPGPRRVTRADAERAAADRAAVREAARAEAKREAEEARQRAEDAANEVADIDLQLRDSTERRDELAARVRELRDELDAAQDELSELTVHAAGLRKERTRAQRASDTAARAAAHARRRADP